ncbi:hypothetical protein Pint_25112 [Pistacia integerrima]|uniref:Uncharacterized protein n=1 Tax=Pistacia integerrima TaxID=434235 RepID=A0ACC0YD78_9ROSI|nr:hypothetical protein Pint_25112 [Pistacia integerrima]
MSYWFSKPPAVGASGAIFGLVGSLAVFVTRHRGISGRGREDLQHIAQLIFLNMVIGLQFKGIDNWGHLVECSNRCLCDILMPWGLLGGTAMSWLLGPAWKSQLQSSIFSQASVVFLVLLTPELAIKYRLKMIWCFKTKKYQQKAEKKAFLMKNGKILVEKVIAVGNGRFNPFRVVSIEDLKRATNNFHEGKIIFNGFGYRLYDGFLRDRQVSVMKFDDFFET